MSSDEFTEASNDFQNRLVYSAGKRFHPPLSPPPPPLFPSSPNVYAAKSKKGAGRYGRWLRAPGLLIKTLTSTSWFACYCYCQISWKSSNSCINSSKNCTYLFCCLFLIVGDLDHPWYWRYLGQNKCHFGVTEETGLPKRSEEGVGRGGEGTENSG